MAQPIKKTTNINPWNYFSKELTTLIDFITREVAPLYGVTEITPELFIYSALENTDCMLYKALNSYLNSFDLTDIHDKIGSKFIKNNGIVGGKVEFSKTLFSLLNDAYELRDMTESQYITSDHVLLAILKKDNNSVLSKLFSSVGVNFKIMVGLSQKVHDVISNDVVNIDEDDIPNVSENPFANIFPGAKVQIIGGTPQDIMKNLQQMGLGGNPGKSQNKPKKTIDFCTNLSLECETKEIEDLVGREKELNAIYNILGRKKCNNALLIGEGGVGKTQCVLGLVKALHDGTAPLQFRNKEVWRLNPAELVAGTQLRGMLEDRVVNLGKQLKANPNAILFIDDIDNIFGKKPGNSDYDTGGALNELFSNGTTQVIATTTYKNYKTILDNNPDIANKFQQVVINKPSIDECLEILNQSKGYYEKFHNVIYSEEIIYHTVNLCNRYITDKLLPASAFDIIDELGSYKKINSYDNYVAKDILKQISDLEKVKDSYIKKDNIQDAADVDAKIEEFRTRLAKLQANINKRGAQKITMDDLYHVISEHTNIPVSKVSATEKEELKGISDKLKKVVVGQDEVIDIISRAIKRNKIGLSSPNSPRLKILEIGESGVGKTLIAKTLAKEIYGDEKYLVRFDMSEYSDETSVNKLIGSSAGYVGYTEGGLLTEAIKNKKYCVLLIDEIEKAHDKVYNLFLQILDEGFITDNTGYKVDFRNTIIIMTSNIGAKRAANTKGIGFSTDDTITKEDIMKKELKNKFPPEFLNRIDDIVYFNPLTDDNLKDIIRLEMGYLKQRIVKIGYDITYTDDVIEDIFNEVVKEKEYGARPIHRAIRDKIENKITDLLIDNDYQLGKTFEITVNEEKGLEIV